MTPEQQHAVIAGLVHQRAEDENADFLAQLNRITSDSPKFWFDYAHALATLEQSQQMDLRSNGCLEAAAEAIERAAALDPNHVAIWAERLIIHRYLAHGLSAAANGLGAAGGLGTEHSERTRSALARFKRTVDDAMARFSDDEWFRVEREDAYDDFGWSSE